MEELNIVNNIVENAESKMKKTIQHFEETIFNINTGRANPNIMNDVYIDYYGVKTKIMQISTIVNLDSQTLKISPYDKSIIKDIIKKIIENNINSNPSNDDESIIIKFPLLSQERRKELVKFLNKILEENKVNIRNIRRISNNSLKKLSLTEDIIKKEQDNIQVLTNKYIDKLITIANSKEKEIMTI